LRLTANAEVATVLGSVLAFSYIVESEGPVPTSDKLLFRFQFRLRIYIVKNIVLKKTVKNLAFLMLIEAALLPSNLFNDGNQINYLILCL
jgi:hypothetical protein